MNDFLEFSTLTSCYICRMTFTGSVSIATEADIPELVILINSAYRGESSKKGWTTEADLLEGQRTDGESLKTLFTTPGSVLLKYVNENNTISACVNLQQQGRKLYLGMLTVSPSLQASGIGKKLLAASEQYARENKVEAIRMTVISIRLELIAWYERHGYNRTGETQPFPKNDPKFGIPKQFLEFVVLEKNITGEG
jgi:predicted N-acetyltransferase YhbS